MNEPKNENLNPVQFCKRVKSLTGRIVALKVQREALSARRPNVQSDLDPKWEKWLDPWDKNSRAIQDAEFHLIWWLENNI